MSITITEVERIAELARIKLTEREKEKMADDMSAILGYIDKLSGVNTDGVEPLAQITGLENIFRKDEPGNADTDVRQNIIDQFPHKKGDHLKVGAVFSDNK